MTMSLPNRAGLLGRRVAGYLLDVLLLMAALAALQTALWVLGLNWARTSPGAWSIHGWVLATVSLPCWLYFTIMPVWRQGTIGHRLLGLRAVAVGGGRPSPARAALRAAILLIPFEANHVALFHGQAEGSFNAAFWIGLAVCYGALIVLMATSWLDRDGRGLHDRAGGLRIVREQ